MQKEKLKERETRQREKLTQTQARLKLIEASENAKAAEKKRRDDTRKKIILGGVVIASGAEQLDPAELCGWLITILENRSESRAEQMKKKGIKHFLKTKSKTNDGRFRV